LPRAAEQQAKRRATEIAGPVKDCIAKEWATHSVMRKFSLHHVILEHVGGDDYTGKVECVLDEEKFSIPIDVTDVADAKQANIRWKLKPTDAGLPVRELNFNGAQVFVTNPVTNAEADAFGAWMAKEGHFAGGPVVCQLSRSKDRFHLYVVVAKAARDDEKRDESFRKLAVDLSNQVFGAAPVTVFTCDENLMPEKSFTHR
jgi:hypothetical protein